MDEKPTYAQLEKEIEALKSRLSEIDKAEDDGRMVDVSSSDGGLQQKPVDVSLHRSTERFRRLFEQASDAFFIHDFHNGKIVDANENACKNLGYTRDELLELSVSDIEISQAPEAIVEICSRAEKGCPVTVEGVHRRKDGSTFPVETSLGMFQDEDPALLLAIVRDTTERKKAEKALRESEERFRQVYEHMAVGVARVSLGFQIEGANEAYCRMLGYRADELIGKHLRDITHPEILEENLRKQSQLAAGEIDHYRIEKKFIHKSGRVVHGILDANLVRDHENKALYFLGSVLDITDRKRAEKAQRESEEKYRSMMESMKDPIYICSSDFRVEYMNPAMIRRTGRDANGERCFKALHDFDEKCPWCMHEKALQGDCLESEIVSPKDNRSYHVSHSDIVREDGSVSKMTIFRDTTDLKTLETQLQQAQKMEAIGTLAGGIAHDFNNILGGVLGYAELAKIRALDGGDVISDLEQLIISSKRAADLVKQILTISRQHKQEQKPVQTGIIVNEALDLLRATLPTTIVVRGDLPRDAGIVNADPTQIHQAIMNLGINAGHAMQEDGGVLEVSLANVELDALSASKNLDLSAGSYLRLTVSDTGHGMPSEITERIFDPYFTTKDTGEGTGLGLSVAHGIVKAHGGTITVYSEPGKGTTFHVYLPIIHNAKKAEKDAPEEPLPTGSERILFIDDEEVLIEIGSRILEYLGYEVVATRCSKEALALFRAEPDGFDLVITDMTMPHMTGDKLVREMMKIRTDIPVILCTGHSRLVSEPEAKAMGIRAFVMKPLVMRNLAETVRQVLDTDRGGLKR